MASAQVLFETDEKTGILVVKLVGDIDPATFRELRAFISNTSYQSSNRCLWDLRGASSLLPSTELRNLALSVKQIARCPRRVAIVAETDVLFGLARMFEMLSEQAGVVTGVFRSYEQARDWLL